MVTRPLTERGMLAMAAVRARVYRHSLMAAWSVGILVGMTQRLESVAPDRRSLHTVAQVAAARARGWSLIVELLSPPSVLLVGRLRTGELVDELRQATDWLGEDAGRFLNVFMVLDTFARRAARRDAAQDLQELADEYARLFPDGLGNEVAQLYQMTDLCQREAEAWADGDHEVGKQLRRRENQLLEDTMLDHMPGWCASLDQHTRLTLYRSAARLLTSYLSVESGRGLDRQLFGGQNPLGLEGHSSQ